MSDLYGPGVCLNCGGLLTEEQRRFPFKAAYIVPGALEAAPLNGSGPVRLHEEVFTVWACSESCGIELAEKVRNAADYTYEHGQRPWGVVPALLRRAAFLPHGPLVRGQDAESR